MARKLMADPAAVEACIAATPEPARERLRTLRALMHEELPKATERMAYGLPTWHWHENIVHVGAFKHHVGLYPGPEAIVMFAEALDGYHTSKGAIQLPNDRPLPLELVRRILRWRRAQVVQRLTGGA